MKKVYVVWTQWRESYDADFEFAFTDEKKAKLHVIKEAERLKKAGYKPGNLDEFIDDSDCHVWYDCVELKKE